MYHSEQKFIIDGDTEENLSKVLDLAFSLSGYAPDHRYKSTLKNMVYRLDGNELVFRAYPPHNEKGWERCAPELVASDENIKKFCLLLIDGFLKGDDANEFYISYCPYDGFDGTCRRGWTVFVKSESCENIGEVFRVKPSWTYYSK